MGEKVYVARQDTLLEKMAEVLTKITGIDGKIGRTDDKGGSNSSGSVNAKLNVLINNFWTIVNKKDTIFKYIFWERLDYLPIPECCFHFIWCQVA